MKTKKDLQIMYNAENGEYPKDVYDYSAWIEKKLLAMMNAGQGFTIIKPGEPWKSSFDRQMEADAKEPWKP